ncbi:MAG: SPASM domain-containing protein [Bacteroidetes bacterium]|nr:SPASM domain-containing protein [Bacteroidota bacterium]
MRASDYIIKIKTGDKGKYLLVHGYTGATDIVNENVVKFLQNIKILRNSISDETFNILKRRGYLTDKTAKEEREYLRKMSDTLQAIHIRRDPKNFYFIPSYNCNFRCPYCYESKISKNGLEWSRDTMTEEMADKAFSVIDKFKLKSTIAKTLNLYGGEPFMAINKEIVEYILEKGLSAGFVFAAITNGYELNIFKDYLGPDKIGKVQITLDGPPEYHNRSRYLQDGSGTFNKIAKNISLALNKKVKVNIRTNVDKNNFSALKELVEIFEKRGWRGDNNFSAYIALKRAHGIEEKCNTYKREGDLLNDWLSMTAKFPNIKIGTIDHGLKKKFNDSIRNKTVLRFKSSFCGANSSMYLFDPIGDIYTCWDVVKQDECIVGKYYPHFELDEQALNNWHGRYVGRLEKCSKCRYALYCGGGCEGATYFESGQFFSNNCNDFPKLFKEYLLQVYEANTPLSGSNN